MAPLGQGRQFDADFPAHSGRRHRRQDRRGRRWRAAVKAEERVLVTGASGGVGSGLIQLCRARAAIPYALVSRGKEVRAKTIGAEAVIIRGQGDLQAAVESATGGAPIDAVADMVAGPLFNDLINLLKPEGRYTTAGAIGGRVVRLDLRTIYLKHLQLHGSSQGSRAAFRQLVGYIEAGKIKALLDRTFPLSRLREAQEYFMAKGYFGKIVVQPDAKWTPIGR